MQYDVFISHASEDKMDVARPLVQHLQRLGLRVWFDETELTLGDSLRRKIDRGLTESRFGVVILSAAFFGKEWPSKELDGLVSREDGREKVILPVWHNVTRDEILKYSPILADKLAVSTSRGLEHVASEILKAVAPARSELRRQIGLDQEYLRFITNTLENVDFLFTATPWPFPTDIRGEDLKSKHTPKSKRDGTVPMRTFSSQYATIAGNELIIGFHLRNLTSGTLYLEMLYLKVEGAYPLSPTMYWNTWLPVLEPHDYGVVLNPAKSFYEVDFANHLIEILPNSVEHFRLSVHGEHLCAGQIFAFRLGAVSHDALGKKGETVSDRTYHVAFPRDNLTTRPDGV